MSVINIEWRFEIHFSSIDSLIAFAPDQKSFKSCINETAI